MESKNKTTKKKTARKKTSKKKAATKKELVEELPEALEKMSLPDGFRKIEAASAFEKKMAPVIIELNTGTDIMHPVLNRRRLKVGANSVKKIVRADDSTFIVTVDNEHDRNNIVRHEIIIPITNVAWWQYGKPDIPK